MRLFAMLVLGLAVLSAVLAQPGGSGGSTTPGSRAGDSGLSREVGAAPPEVIAAVEAILIRDGLEVVSRNDHGTRLRQAIPSTVLARDPEFAALARFGDLVVTARVGRDEVVVRSGFAMVSTAAEYRIAVAPTRDPERSLVTIEARVEEGNGRDSRRLARGLRAVIERNAREILDGLVA